MDDAGKSALRSSEARFRAAVAAVEGILWTNDADGRMTGEQPGWGRLTGQSEVQYRGYGWANAVHPDDAGPTVDAWNAAVARRRPFVFEHRVRTASGQWRLFSIRAVPVLNQESVIEEWVGVHTDITDARRHQRELQLLNEGLEQRVNEEVAHRANVEATLQQVQKMEALGNLTGGVAHDFNNLLQVISGNLQLLSIELNGNERAAKRIENALAGVARGAKLASQLLAFGRRQPLEPKVLNPTRLIHAMDDMLRRTLGEEIEVETVIAGGLWKTMIDPGQIENALLNLAINARDAMDGHGKLTIEASNALLDGDYCRAYSDVTPGQYVLIAVTDTGAGIQADLLERVFEPFFSTKPEGKGSGLGLSMVHGFVKQSGGHVKIYSEVGYGTTVKLYLPRSIQAEDVLVDTNPVALEGGKETILVAEDDDDVRDISVGLLTALGYTVLKARDAASALTVIESGAQIDLLFTDVVMPGPLRSTDLARKAKERMPDIAVLFTSGYTENAIVHGGRLDAGVELLAKPYTREALARKVRYVLGNRAQKVMLKIDRAGRHGTNIAAVKSTPQASALTVLLVQDDRMVRSATRAMLSAMGHHVIEAGNADEAVRLMSVSVADVLITVDMLAQTSGLELARKIRTQQPDIKVIIASGDPAPYADVKEIQAAWLPTPYTATQLAQKLSQVCQPLAGNNDPTSQG
ncbi:MAG: response regulator [Herminiimonas sp.]|nr:response regulator [Herminiimonas sp.]